jgi:hypothetical protein
MREGMVGRFWKFCELAAGVASVVSFFWASALMWDFFHTRPDVPSAIEERIHRLQHHYTTIYLDGTGRLEFGVLFALFVVFATIAIVIDRVKRPFESGAAGGASSG